ncbi:MAG: arginase family protein, partial [Desulfotignum sp.]|nr:arginase family protein [Desulfotignum sp.]
MSRQISLIGVPMDFGQDLRGVDMGPAAVRYTGLIARLRELGHTVRDRGDVPIPIRDEAVPEPVPGNTYVEEITRICHTIYTLGRRVIEKKDFPLFVGGDHSISVGTVAAAGSGNEPLGLIWVDAHGDFNTPDTSPSGNIHGMPLAILMGEGHPDLVNVGWPGP